MAMETTTTTMHWCSHCCCKQLSNFSEAETEYEVEDGTRKRGRRKTLFISCSFCGRVLDSHDAATTGDKPKKERKRIKVGGNAGSAQLNGEEKQQKEIETGTLGVSNEQQNNEIIGKKQQKEIETGALGPSNEQQNNEITGEKKFDVEAVESDNNAGIDGDGKLATAEGEDQYGEFEED